MDNDFHKQFTVCPACGSEDRFLEQLGQEVKDKGWAREEWQFHMEIRSGAVTDKARENLIPIGSVVPGYGFMTDICMDCGCVYATDIGRVDAKISPAPMPPPMQPNRAQRRRDEKGGGLSLPPGMN